MNNKQMFRNLVLSLLTDEERCGISIENWNNITEYLKTFDPEFLSELEAVVRICKFSDTFLSGNEVYVMKCELAKLKTTNEEK